MKNYLLFDLNSKLSCLRYLDEAGKKGVSASIEYSFNGLCPVYKYVHFLPQLGHQRKEPQGLDDGRYTLVSALLRYIYILPYHRRYRLILIDISQTEISYPFKVCSIQSTCTHIRPHAYMQVRSPFGAAQKEAIIGFHFSDAQCHSHKQ